MKKRWIAPSEAVAGVAYRLGRVLAAPRAAYEPFIVAGHIIGWIAPDRVQRLARWRNVFHRSERGIELAPRLDTPQARTSTLAEVARALSAEYALTAWRDERYAVTPGLGGPTLFELERAAARYFGIHTVAAHANGLVGDDDRWQMWLARRSPTKAIDPGLLDNLVGGGVAAGSNAAATLVKEASEEAGVATELARRARPAGSVDICRDQRDGLQRETIHVYDLWLPADFVPANQDGEAVEHRLCVPDVVLSILQEDEITADASLVIVDMLLRHRHIPSDDPSYAALEALRHPAASPRQPDELSGR
jgi:8-oxo-dGTP pyrophosphatase MutT (NUDIX family)